MSEIWNINRAGNPLLVFSSLLDWGEEGRYSPERAIAEELSSRAEVGGETENGSYMETLVMNSRLVRFAVSAIVRTRTLRKRKSRTFTLGNFRRMKQIRTGKPSVVSHVLNGVGRRSDMESRMLEDVDDVEECRQGVSRNLFTGESRTFTSPSSITTPHILDQYQLPNDLVQLIPPVNKDKKRARTKVLADRRKCDGCGRMFSQLSSLRRHKQSGCCAGGTVGTPKLLGQGEGGRRRLQLEEGAMVVLVWEPVDMILSE